jgi:multidrug efflux pump subunit AcrA (membrane-fusion protein)
MKATLEFNLPEESEEHQLAVHGAQWRAVVSELAEELRRRLKYESLDPKSAEAVESIRTKLFEILEDEGLRL